MATVAIAVAIMATVAIATVAWGPFLESPGKFSGPKSQLSKSVAEKPK